MPLKLMTARRIAGASLIGLGLIMADISLAQQPAAAPAENDRATPAIAPFWAKRVTGYLTTRDGVKLRYSALLPKGEGRFPVIVNYSGYDPGSIGGLAYRQNNTAMSVNLDRTLVEHGYAVVGVNARGTACSEGQFDFLGPAYGQDGRDAIEFIAVQPWSNGRVGMANWSWAGMSQIATASERPPHLKAIAPGMVLGDARLDSWAPGGVTAPAFVAEWWNYLHSRWDSARQSAVSEGDLRCLAQIRTNLQTSAPVSISTEILKHPLRDDYIEERHLAARTHLIEVPVLSMESFQDEAVTSREGYYQETLDPGQVWMVQTNGGHDLYESLTFRQTLVAFLDRFVKGDANGFDARPHVEVWIDTASTGKGEHGVVEEAKPRATIHRARLPVAVTAKSFTLSKDGQLLDGEAGEGPADAYAYPSPGPAVDTGFETDAWGAAPADWRTGSLAYTSAPIKAGFIAYGSASVDLWLSSSATDTDLQATLTELRPDGQEVFIQRGWLRLSDRALAPGRSTAVRPVLNDRPETVEALTPNVPVLARLELNKFSYVFQPGSRLRLWIDTPSAWGGYGFDEISVPADNRIWHDADHRSRLVIGVLDEPLPGGDRATCGSLLKEPCRPDPLRRPD